MHDVLVLGAGLSGLDSLYSIRKRFPSWRMKAVEAGGDVGGTWYWLPHRHRITLILLFVRQRAARAMGLEEVQHVAKKHDLYKDIQFNTRIKSAHWNESERYWTFIDEHGQAHKTRFFVSCLGFLSSPTLPDIPGIRDFAGEAFHTSRWPTTLDLSKDFANKHIGVISTGATGIQTITALSKEPSINSLTVFQPTANWSAPLHNSEISADQISQHKTEYDSLFARCAETPTCFIHAADPRKSTEVSAEERQALWEKLYSMPGFAKWLGVFSDTYTDREANKMYSDFMANKIRQRVHDTAVADSLIPKNHGFGTRRVPLESGYFEAYNRPNVHLVDLQKTPIDLITSTGIWTNDGVEHDLDILVFATRFDAITGAFDAIDWHAMDDRPLTSTEDTPRGEAAIWAHQ